MNHILSYLHFRRAKLAKASISGLFKKEMQTKENVMESEGKETVLQGQVKENKC